MDLKDYIRVYPDSLDANVCKNILEAYKKDTPINYDQTMVKFDCVNITEEADKDPNNHWASIHNEILYCLQAVGKRYMSDLQCEKYWPQRNSLEQIKLIHYRANEHFFNDHVDVGEHDSARRFLAFFIYLNDVEEGGETNFGLLDHKVSAKQGSVLCFPPTWQYPHAGLTPVSNDKYVLTTYLHYL